MADVASLIREARLPERTVYICLRPDLVEPYERLSNQLKDANRANAASDSLGGVVDVSAIQAQMAELQEDIQSAMVPFVLRALSRPRFRALLAEHPPRKDDDGSLNKADLLGVNSATYFDALIREVTVSPQLDDETWRILLEQKLSDRQYTDLSEAAWDLCRDKVDLPFSSTA